jgi:hypothetical protein
MADREKKRKQRPTSFGQRSTSYFYRQGKKYEKQFREEVEKKAKEMMAQQFPDLYGK